MPQVLVETNAPKGHMFNLNLKVFLQSSKKHEHTEIFFFKSQNLKEIKLP